MKKYSDLHADVLIPWDSRKYGEYSDYPNRYSPEEVSVMHRLKQFGITEKYVQERFGKSILQINVSEYGTLLAEALSNNCHTLVFSVYDRHLLEWDKTDDEKPPVKKRYERMLLTLSTQKALVGKGYGLHFVRATEDMRDDSTNLIACVEGGAHLISSVNQVEELRGAGVRIFGLMYDTTNALADKQEGLTELGEKCVEYMLKRGLMVDLAHASKKVRSDVMKKAQNAGQMHLVMYTHGSTPEDIEQQWLKKVGERPIEKQEVAEIVNAGGMVGLGVIRPFFESVGAIANRVYETSQLDNGIDHIAIGADWGGVPPTFSLGIDGMHDLYRLEQALSQRFSDEDIDKVMRKNIPDYLKKNLPEEKDMKEWDQFKTGKKRAPNVLGFMKIHQRS